MILRIGIGCHFLYEGLWKTQPSNGFSAEGFLGMAKGPTKGLYYIMLPDLNATERLQMSEVKLENKKDKTFQSLGYTFPVIEYEWFAYYDEFKNKYQLTPDQLVKTDAIFNQYLVSLRDYVSENRSDILGYFGSLKRYQKDVASTSNDAEYQKIRDWDQQLSLRTEGKKFIGEPEQLGENLQTSLWEELTADQKSKLKIAPITYGQNQIPWVANVLVNCPVINRFADPSRMGFLNLAVTLGLSAIGLCLILGFFTRLAALGGAIFMLNVVLSQFPWPTVYPYPPEVVGHSMIFNKDSIEFIALLIFIVLPCGRWGGLDWFLWNYGGKQIFGMYRWTKDPLFPDTTSEKNAA